MLDVSSENLPQKAQGTTLALPAHPARSDCAGQVADVVLRSVLHTLAYADIFDYPLTAPEVCRYLTSMKASPEEVNRVLADRTLFTRVDDYFTLRGREEIAETRRRRSQVAARLWPRAAHYGRIIALLPFVRMVAVTGSLAMNNMDEGKDVDYMIVTAPNHLWTCRALTLLVARLAKLEGVRLCPNYLVTTNALDLKERSLYVAHEVAQMIPLSGADVYREIWQRNGWLNDYLPQASMTPELSQGQLRTKDRSLVQRVLEVLFRLPLVSWFEKWEMDRKIARLTREQSSSFESFFSADVCKGHIDKHKQKTENAIEEKLERIILRSAV